MEKLLKIDSQPTQNSQNFFKRLEFLNLEFAKKTEYKTSTNNYYNFIYRFKEKHNHSLHAENTHLNGLTDLIINLGFNLQKEAVNNKQIFEKLVISINKTDRRIQKA